MLIFSFFGQNFKVNNLATSMSITWPHFWQNIGKCGQVIDLEVFTCFLLNFFVKNVILPAEIIIFLKNKKTTKTLK